MTDLNLEKTDITLGYMPLSDCAPLLVAEKQGFFKEQGLNVELQQEVSWANIRDKLLIGHLDAAHMLSPMLLATHLGIGGIRKAMKTSFALGINGSAITISKSLAAEVNTNETAGDAVKAVKAIKKAIQKRQSEGASPLVIAVVFPFSIHNFLLRDWLASTGINPDTQVELVVLPPSQMVDNLALGHIDAFFAAAPWNSVAIQRGVGECLVASTDLWSYAPDKVLGTTAAWASQNPGTEMAMIRALAKATEWCEENRNTVADIIAEYMALDISATLPAVSGQFAYEKENSATDIPRMMIFHNELANYPWRQHGEWFLRQMQRWGYIESSIDSDSVIADCYDAKTYVTALGMNEEITFDKTGDSLNSNKIGDSLTFDKTGDWNVGQIGMGETRFHYE